MSLRELALFLALFRGREEEETYAEACAS